MLPGSQLRKARPNLRSIAPLTNAVCWGYAVINTLLGLGMFFLYQTTVPLAVANIFSYQVWGMIFLLMGLSTAFGLLTNRHMLVKQTQLVGLIIKALWGIALILRCIVAPQTILITLVWVFFAYIQAATYIYFLPAVRGHNERIT
jgi:hypothetical protein